MWASKDIFRGAVEAAQNHLARAQEGLRLLAQGRLLGEMSTPVTGLSIDATVARRTKYLEFIRGVDEVQLREHLKNVEFQIERALGREEKGTSELEWQRNAILELLEEQNVKLKKPL